MKSVQDAINGIATNRTSGASELAVQALHVITQSVQASKADNSESLYSELQVTLDALAGCRPTMATIYNCVQRFQHRLQLCTNSRNSLPELRSHCIETLVELEKNTMENKFQSILNAADFIHTGATIATCSYSSTLIEAIHNAVLLGKKMSFRILQSQSGDISYGEQTRLRLDAEGMVCQIIPDQISAPSLDGVDIVLLGADTVFQDGSVLNGYPSLKLASTAADHNPPVPVYVLCDSLKFSLNSWLDKTEHGFDLMPANLVTGLISEDGIFTGEAIINYLSREC